MSTVAMMAAPAHVLASWVRQGLARFAAMQGEEAGPAGRALAAAADAPDAPDWEMQIRGVQATLAEAHASPLARAARGLRLDPAELYLLGLAGAVEDDHLVGLAIQELQAGGGGPRPQAHLALALVEALFATALDATALLSCAPIAAHLLELRGDGPLPGRELAVEPRLWAALTGAASGWPGADPVPEAEGALVAAATAQALPHLAAALREGAGRCAVLRGPPRSGRAGAALLLARALGLRALRIPVELWRNSAAVGAACRWCGWLPVLELSVGAGEAGGAHDNPGHRGPLALLVGRDGLVDRRDTVELDVGLPTQAEREVLWRERLGDEELAAAAAVAGLGGPAIAAVAAQARVLAARAEQEVSREHVRAARRLVGADALRLLAQPVDRRVERTALVASPAVLTELDRLAARCRARESLWQDLGGAAASGAGRGVRALFVGDSGTGKTLAASWLAGELGAPLYRVDLAAVMNKYVGESEKNLGRLLDLAAAHDVMLLFDEADALFGARGDGQETGERYANMLTNFLLQRIEDHPGIAILTSNSRQRIDAAFTRRLDAVLEFAQPGPAERRELWRSHLGGRDPGPGIIAHLATWCDLPGGVIRNAVIAAAAACPGPGPIPAAALFAALAREYRKLGRALPAALAVPAVEEC